MSIEEFLTHYTGHPLIAKIADWTRTDQTHLTVCGLNGSSKALVAAALFDHWKVPLMVVLDDAESAGYFYHDLTQLLDKQQVLFFPTAYRHTHKHGATDAANEILRADTLNQLQTQNCCITITYPDALMEKVVSAGVFDDNKLTIAKGSEIAGDKIAETLEQLGFEYVDFVYEPGQFSIRGSIIDIFSFANELPFRIDLFGDEVESIRTFDIEKQLSLEEQQQITIVPDMNTLGGEQVSLFEFLQPNTIVCANDLRFVSQRANMVYDEALVKANETRQTATLQQRFATGDELATLCDHFRTIEFGKAHAATDDDINFSTAPQPLFHKNFDLVTEQFAKYLADGYTIYIASDSKKQTDRIASIFDERGDTLPFTPILKTLHEGFIDRDMRLCCLTDHQIFDRFHKFTLRSDVARSGKVAMTLKELNQFKVGDYVVHIDHGIGRFGGLQTTTINGRPQEVIKLIFKDNDVIFVSIHALHRISKYKSKEGEEPRINKLGTGAWERLKERTKSKVKDIARDLIKLYSQRMAQQGFAYSPDSYLQQELEASFRYEDTPDQLKATNDIKHDMESARPMDRLVCGDVGFGKTEVAIRAAFKAVTDGKQVAVLVPTTVLALQHYKTFSERLRNVPCTIDYLSRAKSTKQVKEILQKLANGDIDILVGTHKIVGKEVKFKDLGLLIIDEEQKFGVGTKEKLKQLKVNVDTLTLTATPIPRTLQFSLMGARDLSVINTPPPNRYPILTEVIEWDDNIIREAIVREIDRNGQVFFINNRIQNIYLLADKLRKLVPDVRVAVAHGQMAPDELENTIVDFINYDYDVLLATTVVESGIDMPNVNTIIVNKANMFGLSDLHQLRGRVGRSNRKAYCYLIAPPLAEITDDARRRLQAIETFAELGSGFNIAMQDLDIRGAGNMLGAEQSGFIADLGYETYQKILNEAMMELRDEEFPELLNDNTARTQNFVGECQIESDLDAHFPADYIANVSERMTLYRELDNLTGDEALCAFESRLIDRFGPVPQPAKDLMLLLRIRWTAMKIGIEKLVLKNGRMTCYLVGNEKSPYYQSDTFRQLITYICSRPHNSRLGERDGKRFATFMPVETAGDAWRIFDTLTKIETTDEH